MVSLTWPTTVHFASGGLSHFLKLLGHSINHSRATGRSLVVVTEYHKPLACQSLDDIFHLHKPLHPLGQFIKKSGRKDLLSLRPARFTHENTGQRIDILKSTDDTRFYSGLLQRAQRPAIGTDKVMLSTGRWQPGLAAKDRVPYTLLDSVSSLSLRGEFAEAVRTRSQRLNRPFLGVHFRNTDHTSRLDAVIPKIKNAINETGITDIYWCTDDLSSIEQARKRLPQAHVSASQKFEKGSGKNLHTSLTGQDARTHLANTFADLYTLSMAHQFIPTAGSWKIWVPVFRENPNVRDSFFGLSVDAKKVRG